MGTNTASLSELNLEGFLREAGDIVERFWLKSFFYVSYFSENMQYLPEKLHTFYLFFGKASSEYESHLVEPVVILDTTTNDEMPGFITARLKS